MRNTLKKKEKTHNCFKIVKVLLQRQKTYSAKQTQLIDLTTRNENLVTQKRPLNNTSHRETNF